MTIEVRCFACGSSYSVNDDKAGKKLRCRECQAIITIPTGPDTVVVQRPVQSKPPRNPESPTRSPVEAAASAASRAPAGGSKTGIIIASVAGGVVILAGLIVGIVFAVKAATDDDDRKDRSSRKDDDNGGTRRKTLYEQHEQLQKDALQALTDYAETLESIRSPATGNAAIGRLNRIADELDRILKRAKALPKLSEADEKKLDRKFEGKGQQVAQRIKTAKIRAAQAAGFNRELQQADLRVTRKILELAALDQEP